MSDSYLQGTSDVRMRGFTRRTPVVDVLRWIDAHATRLGAECVPLAEAAGRVLAQPVVSACDVPGFDRAMMDGYAVQAADTLGASGYNRLPLTVVGEARPGQCWQGTLRPGEAVRIMTGAPLPAGADAVVPAEFAELCSPAALAASQTPPNAELGEVLLSAEVSPHKHVGRQGEDVVCGAEVLPAGRRLRPQDLGLLSSLGVARPAVVVRPRVAILATGNELQPAGSVPNGYRVTDANSPMLRALAERDGGQVVSSVMVPDDSQALLAELRVAAEVVLVSGGSSVGAEDHAPRVLAAHGNLAIHGIAMRPSSPAGMGLLEGKLVFLLPGNPVSCLCAYDFFAGRALRLLAGRCATWPYPVERLPLARKLVSTLGRVDYARVRVTPAGVEPLAIGGASVLSSTTRADGFVVIEQDSEGAPEGSLVDVYRYDLTGGGPLS